MNELALAVGLGAILYAMKALPFVWGRVPQSRLANVMLDLLPVGLLTALLLPPVLVGALQQPALESLLVIAGVVAALCLSTLTGQAAIGIAAGLAFLAVAELV